MIDAHHHLWDTDAREYGWLAGGQPWASDEELAMLRRPFTLDELAPLAAGAGTTGTVVVQTVNDPWETYDLLALAAGTDPYHEPARRSPQGALVAGVVGWVDLAAPGCADAVGDLRAHTGGGFLRGIRHPLLGEADPDWLVRPDVLHGLAELGRSGLCFDVIAPRAHADAVVAAAGSVQELCFVVNHLGAPPVGAGAPDLDEDWAGTIRSLGSLPNVSCKLSGMHSAAAGGAAAELRPYFETVLDVFGPERLMFGSDWPVSSLAAAYGEVCALYRELTAPLTAGERDAIFDGTARRVYRLDEPPLAPLSATC